MKIRHLRTKIILASLPILFLGGLAFFVTSNLLILPGFQKIENKSAINNASRAVDALNNSVYQLNVKVSDWASWDETYNFAKDHNKAYIASNLGSEALGNLEIDYMLFFDEKDQLIEMKHVDIDSPDLPSLPLEQGVKDLFKPGSELLQHSTITDVHKGVVSTPEGIMAVASRPILNTQGEGPSRGSIVFIRLLDEDDQQTLADLTHLKLSYLLASDASVAKSIPSYPSKTTQGNKWVSLLSNTQARAYAIIPDIYGKPTIAVRVDQPRTISGQGQSSMRTFELFTLLAGLLIIITTAILLNWLVVARILGLSKQVVDLRDIQGSTKAVTVSGNDEVTSLGAAINDLLARLHNTYDLRQENLTLEQKVAERTKDLDDQLDRTKRLNAMMVDREIRMKGLKEENAKLRDQLGEGKPE
jgi:sensor domain CHASE-containing protein